LGDAARQPIYLRAAVLAVLVIAITVMGAGGKVGAG
jgi:hypothetical protein